jgi:integrase
LGFIDWHGHEDYEQDDNKYQEKRIYLVTDGLKTFRTSQNYRLAFDYFLKTTIKNDDLLALINTKPSVIESKIISHIEFLKDERKFTYSTIQVHLSAIYHFFDVNDVQLNLRKIKKFLPSDDSESYRGDRPYSIDEINQILSKCDVRSRVVVLLMASTGMRLGAVSGLRLADIQKFAEFNVYRIWVYNNSKKSRYYTFCTPECAQAIDEYLAYRKRFEKLKDSSPLIRDKIVIENPFTSQTGKPISTRAIQLIIDGVLKQTGLIHRCQKKQIMRTHGFRKFFINQLDKGNVNFMTREYLAGHRLPGQNESYVRMSEEDRLLEYTKAIDMLTISSEGKLKQQLKSKEKDNQLIYEELYLLNNCVLHLSSQMEKAGIDSHETKVKVMEYSDNIVRRIEQGKRIAQGFFDNERYTR